MKVSKCLLYLAPLFSLFGCSQQNETKVQETETQVVNHDYDEVGDYELMWDTMFDVETPQYYVYIYSTTCSHCEDLKNYIIEKALSNKNIYFVKGSSKDQIGNNANKPKYAENPGDIWILGYPSLLEFHDKKCIKSFAGNDKIYEELK